MTRPSLMVGRYRAAIVVAALAVVLACAESTVPAGPAHHLTLLGGDGQTGAATRALPIPLTLRVSDDAGMPVAGLAVTWQSADPGAQFYPATDRTDAEGMARTRWILGVQSGPQAAEATVGAWDDRIAATAIATPGFKAIALMRGTPYGFMCAIDRDAEAWCWSTFEDGEPARIGPPGTFHFRALASSQYRTCGIAVTGQLWCWGPFDPGGAAPTPVQRGVGLEFRSIDGEYLMMCGVTSDHDGYCWGPGTIGDGQPRRQSDEPVLLAGAHKWQEISVTEIGACGVTLAGQILCWTDQTEQAMDVMALEGEGPFLTPTPVAVVSGLAALTGGDLDQCGLIAGGTSALCWGVLGPRNGAQPIPYNPIPSAALHKLSAAYEQSAALDSRGTVWAWGHLFECCHRFFDGPTRLVPEGIWADIENTGDELYAIAASDSTVHRWTYGHLGGGWSKVADDFLTYKSLRWPLPVSVPGPP